MDQHLNQEQQLALQAGEIWMRVNIISNRIERLKVLKAPPVIIHCATDQLQRAVQQMIAVHECRTAVRRGIPGH